MADILPFQMFGERKMCTLSVYPVGQRCIAAIGSEIEPQQRDSDASPLAASFDQAHTR